MKNLLKNYKSIKRSADTTEDNKSTLNKKPREESLQCYGKTVDFLILGAQKAGTMAAVKNLNKHPDIGVVSEVQFFTFCWDFGVPWYQRQLRKTSKRIVGEKTPELIYCDDCALRIKNVCPEAKFILFLRDPIKRAYSSWNMEIQRGNEELSFEECVERELSTMMGQMRTFGFSQLHFVQRGFYLEQIQRFQRVFPNKEQMLIVIAEHMRSHAQEQYNRIFRFLGVTEFEFEAEEEHVRSYSTPISEAMKLKLRDIYTPHNEALFRYLGYRIPEWECGELSPDILELPTYPSSDI